MMRRAARARQGCHESDRSLKTALQTHSSRVPNGYSTLATDHILLAALDTERWEVSKQIKQRSIETLTQWPLIKGYVVFFTRCGVFCGVFRQKSNHHKYLW